MMTQALADATKRGSEVTFGRGMFGLWTGTVVRSFESRRWNDLEGPVVRVRIRYKRANGTIGFVNARVIDLLFKLEDGLYVDAAGSMVRE
jgi:hypothetical protein